MNEDERYRSSTQFRLWSFTPERLATQRAETNAIAAERVKEAIQRARIAASRATSVTASGSGETSEVEQANGAPSKVISSVPADPADVNCLTVEEELKLVEFYCRQTLQLGDHLKLPTDVKATAVQYIKRFYITNSPMTYHPTAILKTALYFATKTENHYFRLTKYCELIGKTKPEDVLASEFLLTQGLRFTFDVRHPFRALEGAVMELMALADGQMGEQQLPADMDAETLKNKIRDAHGKAREYLKTSALLTDVYFHFTPSQIMFSTLLLASPDLVTFYLSTKYPLGAPVKLFNALQRCAAMLQSCPPSSEPSQEEIKELKKLNRKLQKCQNPEMVDLVRLNKERKREGGEEGLDEGVVKKRRLERERTEREAEELFGPKLGAIKDENGVKAMEGVESGGGGTPAE